MKLHLSFLAIFGLLLVAECKTEQSLPNIILICVDDMGWSDLGCYGSEIHTPRIDRIAEKGIRFTHIHNTSRCFPSRACLITGADYPSEFNGTEITPIQGELKFLQEQISIINQYKSRV